MAVSTAPAARQKVLDLLTARAALSTVTIMRGAPVSDDEISQEMMWLGTTNRLLEPRVLGAQRLDEEYRFPVHIVGRTWGEDEAACEARGWALVAEVEAAVRADLRLGDVLNEWALFGEQTLSTEPLADGFVFRASVELVCRARI